MYSYQDRGMRVHFKRCAVANNYVTDLEKGTCFGYVLTIFLYLMNKETNDPSVMPEVGPALFESATEKQIQILKNKSNMPPCLNGYRSNFEILEIFDHPMSDDALKRKILKASHKIITTTDLVIILMMTYPTNGHAFMIDNRTPTSPTVLYDILLEKLHCLLHDRKADRLCAHLFRILKLTQNDYHEIQMIRLSKHDTPTKRQKL